MLYLIKLKGETNTLLKIGYTKDIDKRLKAYKTHNPLVELVDIKEGNTIDESFLHNKLKQYLFDNSEEWFIENDEVYNTWNNYNSKKLTNEQEETILKIKIFKKLIELANLTNSKDSEYLTIYLGDVRGSRKDAMFNYFFKEELHITKPQYTKGISKLIEECFLISTENDKIFILNPSVIEYVNSIQI